MIYIWYECSIIICRCIGTKLIPMCTNTFGCVLYINYQSYQGRYLNTKRKSWKWENIVISIEEMRFLSHTQRLQVKREKKVICMMSNADCRGFSQQATGSPCRYCKCPSFMYVMLYRALFKINYVTLILVC